MIRKFTFLPAMILFFCSGLAAAQDRIVIAAFGDSLTHGFGLAQGDGFVPQLQAWLDARQAQVDVMNAGVSGDTTSGGLARIDWTLTPEVQGVIVELGGNDFLRGIDPALSRANLDGILTTLSERGVPAMISGMKAPLNYGPDYKAAFDGMYADLAAAHGALLHPYFLQGLGISDDAPQPAQGLMQRDGIHPSREGVALIVEDIGPYVLEFIARIRDK